MVWLPRPRVEVVKAARPALLRATTTSLPPSILKVTDPVGGPTLAAETVAVNVTRSPGNELLSDEASAVVVSRGFTSCVTLLDVLLLKLTVSLTYWAKTVCVPTDKEDVVKLAWPDPSRDCVATVLPSMLKTTDPVGIAAFGAALTKAVKVTESPSMVGLPEVESV